MTTDRSNGFPIVRALGIIVLLVAAVGAGAAPSNGGGTFGTMGAVTPGTWTSFGWAGPTLPVDIDDNPFTFTCVGSCTVRITDAFICGDRFEVRDGGDLIATTSAPNCSGASNVSDPEQAYADSHFSHATLTLDDGPHSLELRLISGYFDGQEYSGGAFLALSAQPVPALSPGALAALAAVLAMAGLLAVRRFM